MSHQAPSRILLAVVGQPSSGKDTVADYLVRRYQFSYCSTSDSLRDLVAREGLGVATRERLGEVARELRGREGGDILVRNAIDAAGSAQRKLIGGLRAVSEAELVHRMGGRIICVDAPFELRFERAKQRGRLDDNVSPEAFLKIERDESTGRKASDQNVTAVMGMADYVISNTGSEADLFHQIDSVVVPLVAVLEEG